MLLAHVFPTCTAPSACLLPRSFLKLCGSREELAHLPHGPKLVLASMPSLEAGHRWADGLCHLCDCMGAL